MMQKLIWRIAKPPKFNKVPEKPGIYIISTLQEVDQEYEVKYIGHTDNLRVRVNEHFSKNEANKDLKDHIDEYYHMKINYSLVETKAHREGMVLYLYNFYKPIFNPEPPPDVPIVKCTVPAVRKVLG